MAEVDVMIRLPWTIIRVGQWRPGVLDAVLAGLTQLQPQMGAPSTGTEAFTRGIAMYAQRSYAHPIGLF